MLKRILDARTWITFYLTRWLKPRQWVLMDGLLRGLGRRTFTLTDGEGNSDSCLQELIGKIDEVIRSAPNPMGIDDFLIGVRVFKRPPNPSSHGSKPDRQYLLACEFCLSSEEQNYLLSRQRDWKHGDAKQRLTNLLRTHYPTPGMLVEVAVTSIGQLLVELAKEQRISLLPR